MDKQLIERIALEAAEEFISMANTSPLVFKCHIPEFAHRFLARIDAERGNEAVGQLVDEGFKQIHWFSKPPVGSLLFRSPTIPEGMALDAARYRYYRDRVLSEFHPLKACTSDEFDSEIAAEMLAAAQGERNAD